VLNREPKSKVYVFTSLNIKKLALNHNRSLITDPFESGQGIWIHHLPFRSLLISTMDVWAGEGGAEERGMESILYGYSRNFNCTRGGVSSTVEVPTVPVQYILNPPPPSAHPFPPPPPPGNSVCMCQLDTQAGNLLRLPIKSSDSRELVSLLDSGKLAGAAYQVTG
jgi:hypothetical protein